MTLYRKYRPKNLTEVIGQDYIVELLQAAIAQGRVAHAYLFAGPRGTGKTSVARILAKALNCERRQEGGGEVPCNECAACKAIDAGSYMDVVELDAASQTGVDNMRQLTEQVATAPALGGYKVYILDEVHMLSASSFAALLKTLEEPPKDVVFVMCTTDPHKVPVTIASRCQRLQFRRASVSDVERQLTSLSKAEGIAISEAAVGLLAELADGGYRDAAMLLEQVVEREAGGGRPEAGIDEEMVVRRLGLATTDRLRELIEAVHQGQAEMVVKLIEEVVAEGGDGAYLVRSLIEWWRLILLVKVNRAVVAEAVAAERLQQIEGLAAGVEVEQVVAILEALMRVKIDSSTGHPGLALEVALLRVRQGLESGSGEVGGKAEKVVVSKSAPKPVVKSTPELAVPQAERLSPPGVESSVEEISVTLVKETKEVPAPEVTTVDPVPAHAPAELLQAWAEIVVYMNRESRSLAAVLRDCTPLSYDGKILVLQLWSQFFMKRMEVEKNRRSLEEVATRILGSQVVVQYRLGDPAKKPRKRAMSEEDVHNVEPVDEGNAEELMDAASKIFGGEIV